VSQIRDERRLAAPPELVWEGVSTPGGLLGWFWPPRLDPQIEVDLRVGGRYRIASQVAGMAVSGEYTQVRPDELLGFSWRWDGEELASSVTVTLTADPDGTTLVVDHDGLAHGEVANHVQGWSDCLDRLPGWLAARAEA
jgi:uncharacterized protein YndB with AHSA1/START domain